MENSFLSSVLIFVGVTILLIFVAVILILVFSSNRENARKKKQRNELRAALRKDGVLAPAIIISSKRIGETRTGRAGKSGGSSVSHIIITYQVDVQPEGQPAFHAIFTDYIDKNFFLNYSLGGGGLEDVGRKLWVCYNPNDPSQMVFQYYDYDRRTILGRAEYDKLETRNKILRETGEQAMAVIRVAEDLDLRTRFEKDFNIPVGTYMRLELEVTAKDGSAFQAETQAVIGNSATHKFVVGKKVYIKFNPQDRTQVALDRSAE